jgi:integrase
LNWTQLVQGHIFFADALCTYWDAKANGRTPLGRDNVWRRRIGPQLKAAGLEWVDFHVMRRTHSTLMNEIHDDPKLVADQLGHTVDVNQNVYTRASIARRKTAVDALENALPVQ